MQLFIGGAYAGKRAEVRRRFDNLVWHSAYEGGALEDWLVHVSPDTTLVLEGWERWLAAALDESTDDDLLRSRFTDTLKKLVRAECEHDMKVVLVMLEMGRGIVPLVARERRLRDLAGWLSQDATVMAGQVWYVWNGLARSLR